MFEQMPRSIRKHREAAELTQSELANKVNCSQNMISKIEGGSKIPSLGVIISIADVLHLPIDELIGRKVS